MNPLKKEMVAVHKGIEKNYETMTEYDYECGDYKTQRIAPPLIT